MAYGLIDISEVGEAEVPLIRVLAESIFGAVPEGVEAALAAPAEGLMLIAHLEGNPIGFLLERFDPPAARIDAVGLLSTYRREGTGSRMLEYAERAAKARGCGTIVFTLFGECQGLRGCALARGYATSGSLNDFAKAL
jgi:GNAT superfamily N-acetyltransferase